MKLPLCATPLAVHAMKVACIGGAGDSRADHKDWIIVSPAACGSSLWLASFAPAGVYSLMYTSLPSLLLSTAAYLTMATSAHTGAWPRHKSLQMAHEGISILLLAAHVPEVSPVGRLVTVLAGRGLALILSALAMVVMTCIAKVAVTTKVRQPALQKRVQHVYKACSGRYMFIAVSLASLIHVFVALQLAWVLLCLALAAACSPTAHLAQAKPADEVRLDHFRGDRGGQVERKVESGRHSRGIHGGLSTRLRPTVIRLADQMHEAAPQTSLPGVERRNQGVAKAGPAMFAFATLASAMAFPGGVACFRAALVAPDIYDVATGLLITWCVLMTATESRAFVWPSKESTQLSSTGVQSRSRSDQTFVVRASLGCQTSVHLLLVSHACPEADPGSGSCTCDQN